MDAISIDVIVPAFKGFEQTRRCIEGVLASSQSAKFDLIVVDDATPDPAIATYLDGLAEAGAITLLRNERNVGFVGSVNHGMSLHPDRDVVLLNSDTETANDWLDRLQSCAYREEDIGTVTPFSNNATICSYPHDGWTGDVPGTLGLSGLDRLVSQANAGCHVDIPTAVGFCMYIRRACLDKVGLFDEQRFGRGYGEENDFCLRAAACGWRSVLAADVFVFHEGNVSFGGERFALQRQAMSTILAAHPGYLSLLGDFSSRDPVRTFRRAIDQARLRVSPAERSQIALEYAEHRAAIPALKPTQLHLTHSWDGGTNRWIADFCAHDSQRRNLVLRSVSNRDVACWRLELLDPSSLDGPLMYWNLAQPIDSIDIANVEYRAIFKELIDLFDVEALLVSSLVGHTLDPLEAGLPVVMVLHDLYPFCPAMFAYFREPCVSCSQDRLESCMRHNSYNAFWHNSSSEHWLAVRDAYADRLAQASVTLVAPSESAWQRWTTLFPHMSGMKNERISHGIDFDGAAARTEGAVAAAGRKLRIVVPGRLLPHKGLDLFAQALPRLLEHAEILLLGCGKFGAPFESMPGVQTVRTYTRDDLASHVREFSPDFALLLSVVPESFSYTLSEMFAMGLPVVATRSGAFVERIENGVDGQTFDPEPDALVDLVLKLSRNRSTLADMKRNVLGRRMRNVDDMVRDYNALLPTLDRDESARSRHRPSLVASQRWLVRAAERRQALERDNMDLQRVVASHTEKTAILEADLSRARARNTELEEQVLETSRHLAAIFASRSWRITAPVRFISGGLRRLLGSSRAQRVDGSLAATGNSIIRNPVLTRVFAGEVNVDQRAHHGRELRERLGVPSKARVVVGFFAGRGEAFFRCFEQLALATVGQRNDTVFLMTVDGAESDGSVDLDASLLQATRRLFIWTSANDMKLALTGADVLVLDASDRDWDALVTLLSETGAKAIGIDPACVENSTANDGSVRLVRPDSPDRMLAVLSMLLDAPGRYLA